MRPQKITAEFVKDVLPPRKKNAHKGDSGRVLIIAGSRGMVGAAVLCATASVRSGAGLVRCAVVKSQQNAFIKRAPLEVTTQALPEDPHGQIAKRAWGQIQKTLKQFQPDVVALGPGLGTGLGPRWVVRKLLKERLLAIVLDADALNVLSMERKPFDISGSVVMTPHEGEISRLLKWPSDRVASNRVLSVNETVKKFSVVCLLKGPETLVAGSGRIRKNTTGNPAMASGGMGDILTGILAAIWAQQERQTLDSGWRSACAAAYLHGLLGDFALKRFPEKTMLASDLNAMIPKVFKTVFKRRFS